MSGLASRCTLVSLLLLALAPLETQAHNGASAYLDVARSGQAPAGGGAPWQVTWDLDLRDLHVQLDLDPDRDGTLTWREVLAQRERIAAHLASMVRIGVRGEACHPLGAGLPGVAGHAEGDLLRVAMEYRCAPGMPDVDASPIFKSDAAMRILLTVEQGQSRPRAVALSAQSPRWEQGTTHRAAAMRFLLEGMHHLVTGYDHLAFLAVLLIGLVMSPVPAGGARLRPPWRSALGIVTAFTVAHSLTLGLAATGLVRLPAAPVEAAIAASIGAAALLNLLPAARRFGWQLALGFGLVHGFGFAGALAAMAPRIDLWALAAFNLGIELAQIACAAILLPALCWVLRPGVAGGTAGGRRIAAIASVGFAMLAAWWLFQRLAFTGA